MRVKGGTVTKRRHNKILKLTKGYRMTKSKLYKPAHQAYMHAGQYSYVHRRQQLGVLRKLWIQRINAGAKQNGLSYREFINKLVGAKVELNRKMLADLAMNNPQTFAEVIAAAK